MKVIILMLILILQSCSLTRTTESLRDEEFLLRQVPADRLTTGDINDYPHTYLTTDSILEDEDTSTGLISDSYYTGLDSTRFSISANYSQDYEDPTKVQMFDFQYFSRLDNSYRQYWWGLQIKTATAKYSAIAEESTSNTGAGERADNLQGFTIFGLGASHRFRALASEFFTDRFFETIAVFGNYVIHADETDAERYTGYGYTAEYGLNYRPTKSLFYGGKFSYNWAWVERGKDGDESLPARSLTFGWLTLGFELGYYF